ncbi:MAG: retropepsin-like aspartic protease [Flavobacterium sp.]|uniref:retropepsin-like aspartic protease n=1 Tax=Flavobacterium sp. TaxID=239 RepID=UPI003263C429
MIIATKLAIVLTAVFLSSFLEGQENKNSAEFAKIYSFIQHQNYFKARDEYAANKEVLSAPFQLLTEVILDNAFNRCAYSQKKITELLKDGSIIADSLKLKMLKIKTDNAIKLFQYKDAKNTIAIILAQFKSALKREEIADFENSFKIWSALENVAPQQVTITKNTVLKMTKDTAGLKNLKVSANSEPINFIFDTGANLCTTTQSAANRFNMKLFKTEIEVNSITGNSVKAHLAVCKKLTVGNITIENVIFLVMADKELAFEQIKYQINGILGFPVIAALNEVKITRDGDFIVSKNAAIFNGNSNIAMEELTPIVDIQGAPYTFDTGADHTTLYHAFYLKHQEEINKLYKPQKIKYGGAGGVVESDGFLVTHTFDIAGQKVALDSIHLLKEKTKPDEKVFGNIGQDVIQQFESMILNFKYMYLKFE